MGVILTPDLSRRAARIVQMSGSSDLRDAVAAATTDAEMLDALGNVPLTAAGGYTMNMVQTETVTAAAVDFTDGSMVALFPTPEQAQALALPDGQPADTLHVTLAFLPEGVEEPEWLAERLAALATWFPPLDGTVGGLGMFAPGDDGVPVIALPDVVGLADLRVAVCELLAESQVVVADTHGFLPHLTLTYGDARMDPPLGFPLTFSSLSLVVGAERWDVPFGAAIVAAFDPAKHPHLPSGSDKGGEWAPKGESSLAPAATDWITYSNVKVGDELRPVRGVWANRAQAERATDTPFKKVTAVEKDGRNIWFDLDDGTRVGGRAGAKALIRAAAPENVTAAFDPSKHARVKAGTRNRKRDPREGGQFAPKDGGNAGKSDDEKKPVVEERHPDGTPKGWGLGPNYKMKPEQVVGQPGGVPQAAAPDAAAREILKGAKDTEQLYAGDGPFGYTEERVNEFQNPAIQSVFKGHSPVAEPETLFMAGGAGSGKSSILKAKPELKPPDAVEINPDDFKLVNPEYRDMFAAGSTYAAAGTHEESSSMAKRALGRANEGSYNAVLDGTGNNPDPSSFMGKVNAARDAGRNVKIVMADIPTEESIRRANARAADPKSDSFGRVVNEQEIRSQHKNVARNHLIWRDEVGDWEVWSNDDGPKLIAKREGGGKIEVLDEARYQQALDKANEDAAPKKPKRRLRRNR